MHPKKSEVVYCPLGPLPSAIRVNACSASDRIAGISEPLILSPLVVSIVMAACASFSTGTLVIFLI